MPSEEKMKNPYPYPTATDVANAPGSREIKAARNLISRNVEGIPKRGYVLGDCDHAPILRGLEKFTTLVYVLLDLIEDSGGKIAEAEAVREMMEDHRCPPGT